MNTVCKLHGQYNQAPKQLITYLKFINQLQETTPNSTILFICINFNFNFKQTDNSQTNAK